VPPFRSCPAETRLPIEGRARDCQHIALLRLWPGTGLETTEVLGAGVREQERGGTLW